MALTKIDDRGLKTPVDLLDDEKIRFGTGNDLEILHSGNYSKVEDSSSGGLILRNTSGADVFIQSDGNTYTAFDGANRRVGIGTITPACKLDVVGTTQLSGAITGTSNLNLGTKVELQGAGTSTFSAGNTVFGAADVSQNTYLMLFFSVQETPIYL